MKAMIFYFLFMFPMIMKAQALSDTIQTSLLPEIEQLEVNTEFQISFDVSSMTAVLLGGSPQSSFHLGVQAKRVVGNTAYRFTGEFYPQTKLQPFFSNTMLEEALGNEVRYLVFNEDGKMMRFGSGTEKRKEMSWGQAYLGMDMSLIGETVDLSSITYWETTNDTTLFLSNDWNFKRVNSFGMGLSPFIGYEFQPWKHFGFNLEAKLNAMMMVTEGYNLNRETAELTSAARVYDFR